MSVLTGLAGFQDGNMAGMAISLTAVKQWLKNKPLRDRVMDEVLSGKKKMCLAITEAFAGSDVAGLRTTAEKTPDGKYYIVNGTKKWITNGMFADYFVTGCRTRMGFSVLLIPRGEGVETTPIKTSYSTAAATAFVQFDNVKVPVENLLGEEDKGFIVIMSNFNHERFMMVCAVVRMCMTVVEECLKWCNQRIVFGKKLIEQPAIRQKCVFSLLLLLFLLLTDKMMQTRPHDLPLRIQPSLARIHHPPDVQHDLRRASQTPGRAHRPAEIARHALRRRDRRPGDQHLWRPRPDADGHGPRD